MDEFEKAKKLIEETEQKMSPEAKEKYDRTKKMLAKIPTAALCPPNMQDIVLPGLISQELKDEMARLMREQLRFGFIPWKSDLDLAEAASKSLNDRMIRESLEEVD